TLKSKNDWEQNINVLRTFASRRPHYLHQHISEYFNLDGTDYIEVEVAPPGSGKIKVNTILIDEYPWSGDYFIDVPIQLTALPGAGYRFAGWSGLSSKDSTNQQVSIRLPDVYLLRANFEKSEELFSVIINEINYNSSNDFDPEDWIELYNSGSSSIDMSNWIFRDNEKSHKFTFPPNTIIPADGYLVLCRDLSAFRKFFPSVKNAIGDFNFGLASDQEIVCLFDRSGNAIDSVAFTNLPPWPLQPNGAGSTLSLKAPYLDNAMAQNWGPSIGYGTPGAANKLSSDVDENQNNLPKEISLYQNYPNPFNAITKIPYAVSETAWVDVSIYNINGRMVATCESQTRTPGTYIVIFDASRFASGLYFYRLTVGSVKIIKKMMVLE
ncbi:MAG: T9SS C-terminal target domain-containing protein, partial [Calditrichaeota bacterium]